MLVEEAAEQGLSESRNVSRPLGRQSLILLELLQTSLFIDLDFKWPGENGVPLK